MPVDVNGLFVLTLKFSEVYFDRPGQKIFSVLLNDHTIIKNLDVFKNVGKNAAYDEQVEFRVSNTSSEIIFESAKGSPEPAVSVPYDGTLTVRFVPGGCVSRLCANSFACVVHTAQPRARVFRKDNPKVNALLVTQGSLGNHTALRHATFVVFPAVVGTLRSCSAAERRLKHAAADLAGRANAVAAVAAADLKVQQVPQTRDQEPEEESSGELGLGARSQRSWLGLVWLNESFN